MVAREEAQALGLMLIIGLDLTDDERAILHRSVVEMYEELAPVSVKGSGGAAASGVVPPEYFVYLEAAAAVADTAKYMAAAVLALRHKLKKHKVTTSIRVERRGKPPINLNVASDEEVTIYITDGGVNVR